MHLLKVIKPERVDSEKGLENFPYDPCPFCGHLHELSTSQRSMWAIQISKGCSRDYVVVCPSCGAIGPWAITKKLALKLWNRRQKYNLPGPKNGSGLYRKNEREN
jgi:hypothetical protein